MDIVNVYIFIGGVFNYLKGFKVVTRLLSPKSVEVLIVTVCFAAVIFVALMPPHTE